MANTSSNAVNANVAPATGDVEAAAVAALNQAEQSLDQIKQEVAAQPVAMPEFAAAALPEGAVNGIELLGDVELHVTVELGRTQMLVEDVLRLSAGSVVELDKLAGDPVDVFVNGRLIARGEVLVLNDNFCIRVSEIVADLEDQVTEAASQQTAGHSQASQTA